MSLSEQEQRALREIEQSLLADDPKFGTSVPSSNQGGLPSGSVSLKAIAIGVVGLIMLIGGVALAQTSLWFIALSILGFLVMFGAGIWALKGGGDSAPSGGRGNGDKRPRPSSADDSGVASRMEENFRRRFEGQ